MSTKPAFIVKGTWSEDSRKHAALRFVESVANFIEQTDHSTWAEFYTEDFTGVTPYGEDLEIGNWGKAIAAFYSDRFNSFIQVPYSMIAIDSEDGYDVYILSNLYADIKGDGSSTHTKVTDDQSREWDIRVPCFNRLDLVKAEGAPHEGLKLRHLHWMQDTKIGDELAQERGINIPKHLFARHQDHHDHVQYLK